MSWPAAHEDSKKRKEKIMTFGVKLLRSPVLYRAAQLLIKRLSQDSSCHEKRKAQEKAIPFRVNFHEKLSTMPGCPGWYQVKKAKAKKKLHLSVLI